jgi:uncharacterized protein
MTAQPKSSDPSMEEILSSIRRIIADDQAKAAQKDEVAHAPPTFVPPAAAPAPLPPIHDDVFDLTPELIAEPAADYDQDDVDLLFREIEETHAEEVAIAEPEVFAAAPAPEAWHQPVMAPAAQVAAPPMLDMSSLISPQVGATVSGAFSQLAHTVLSQNARTLDDLVQEMLKPMLKGWLDENLPTVVERLVRAEIERVARGGR